MIIKCTSVNLSLDKIKIPNNFKQTLPNNSKLCERLTFYKNHGCFDREILVDEKNVLVDGYAVYLIAKMVGKTSVRCVRIKCKFTSKELVDMLRKSLEEWHG